MPGWSPLHGQGFTWTNGQAIPIWVRLDCFLLSQNWSSLFPRTCQFALPRFGSDHAPIYLEFGPHFRRSRAFHFEKSWYSDENLDSLIQEWWSENNPEGCKAFILAKRLIFLKHKLRRWASESFGSLRIHKNLLLELHSHYSISESRALSNEESQCNSQVRLELSSMLRQEELFWKQRSRITWLKEGDANTKYFHLIANGRRNKNFIPRICHNGSWVEGNSNLGRIFSDHFGNFLRKPRLFHFLLDWQHLFEHREYVDLTYLEQPFSAEEIKQALFDLGADKAPGLDGFPMLFF